jgi:hypothetical protein
MKITDIKATIVSVPLEAPLPHAAGAHCGRFVRAKTVDSHLTPFAGRYLNL